MPAHPPTASRPLWPWTVGGTSSGMSPNGTDADSRNPAVTPASPDPSTTATRGARSRTAAANSGKGEGMAARECTPLAPRAELGLGRSGRGGFATRPDGGCTRPVGPRKASTRPTRSVSGPHSRPRELLDGGGGRLLVEFGHELLGPQRPAEELGRALDAEPGGVHRHVVGVQVGRVAEERPAEELRPPVVPGPHLGRRLLPRQPEHLGEVPDPGLERG